MKPPEPSHGRKLGLASIAITPARNPKSLLETLDAIRDDYEARMIDCGYLEGAHFSWITIALKLGLKFDLFPTYGKVNKKYGDLPLSIELDVRQMLDASDERMRNVLAKSVSMALIHAARTYDRPIWEE